MSPKFSVLKFFSYAHLPQHLQIVSKPFCDLAEALVIRSGENDHINIAETMAGLRKLLEAKDCAVRAMVK